jgi:tRNA-binding protein
MSKAGSPSKRTSNAAHAFPRRYLSAMATPDEFFAIDMRVGTVVHAEPFPEARKPSIKLVIDFGAEIGRKQSSAQLTMHYVPEQLLGRQVVAAVNLGARRIAGFTSEVLVLGGMPTPTEVVLLSLDQPVADGTRIG